MPIRAKWLLEGRIVYCVMDGEITLTDIMDYDALMINMMNEGTGQVHSIIDLRGITRQANLKDVMRVRSIFHARSGWGITVGAMENSLSRMLTTIVVSIAQAHYRDVRTAEEALEFLQAKDLTLPDLKPLLEKIG